MSGTFVQDSANSLQAIIDAVGGLLPKHIAREAPAPNVTPAPARPANAFFGMPDNTILLIGAAVLIAVLLIKKA